jgi:hypothetical protein
MVIASLGVVNGFILSFFLMFKKQNTWSNVYFGGLLMALSIRIGKSVFVFFSDSVDRLILQIGLSACIFIGPLFYLYVKALKEKYGFIEARYILINIFTFCNCYYWNNISV